jgi:YVTN family beta-propeller protein
VNRNGWYLTALFCLFGLLAAGYSQGIASTHALSVTPVNTINTFLPIVINPPIAPSLIATIALPLHPHGIVINPETGKVYIRAGYTHVAILTGTDLIELLQLEGANADQMALDVSDNILYVVHAVQGQKSITVIQDDQIVTRLDIPLDQIRDLAIHPDTHELNITGYITTPEEGFRAKLVVMNKSEILNVVDLGKMVPNRIVIDPIFEQIYIGGYRIAEDGSLTTIGTFIIMEEGSQLEQLDLGQSVEDIAIDPNTGNTYATYIPAYANGTADGDLSLFRDGNLITTIQVAQGHTVADSLRIHPITSNLYALDPANWQVSVISNTNDQLEVIGTAPVGSGAVHIALDPMTGNGYVANFNDDTVSVLHGPQTIATINVGWYPFGLAVNPRNGWVYVSNTNDGTVSVLGYDE